MGEDVAGAIETLKGELDLIQTPDVAMPSAAEIVLAMVAEAEAAKDRGDGLLGVSSCMPVLDRLWKGFAPGEVYVLAGRPGHGKSALAQTVAGKMLRKGTPVSLFNFEATSTVVMARIISAARGLPEWRIRAGDLDDLGWAKLALGVQEATKWPLHLWGQTDCPATIPDVRRRLETLRRRGVTPPLVIVDHAHAMSSGAENRVDDLRAVVQGAKEIARDFDTAVWLLAQANRETDRNKDTPPEMNDVKGSGAFDEWAGVVAFVWANPDDPSDRSVVIRKNRFGEPRSLVPMRFRGEILRWEEIP